MVNIIIGNDFECPSDYFLCEENLADCCQQISSSDFEIEYDLFPMVGNVLDDVVIDGDEFWAVGSIETDTSINIKNLIHYSDSGYTFFEVKGNFDLVHRLHSIDKFGDEMWAGGAAAYHFDGENWTQYNNIDGWFFNGIIQDIWIENSNSVYFAGDHGGVFHYNGSELEDISLDLDIQVIDNQAVAAHNGRFDNNQAQQLWNLMCKYRAGYW